MRFNLGTPNVLPEPNSGDIACRLGSERTCFCGGLVVRPDGSYRHLAAALQSKRWAGAGRGATDRCHPGRLDGGRADAVRRSLGPSGARM